MAVVRGMARVQKEELNSDTGLDKVAELVAVVVAVPALVCRLDAAQLVRLSISYLRRWAARLG